MINMAKTAAVEATVKAVAEGDEGEAMRDSMRTKRIIKPWMMTTMVAVPREVETTNFKMRVVEMDKNTGTETEEETTEATEEVEDEDPMVEEEDTVEDAAEDHGVGNIEATTVEVVGVVIATR